MNYPKTIPVRQWRHRIFDICENLVRNLVGLHLEVKKWMSERCEGKGGFWQVSKRSRIYERCQRAWKVSKSLTGVKEFDRCQRTWQVSSAFVINPYETLCSTFLHLIRTALNKPIIDKWLMQQINKITPSFTHTNSHFTFPHYRWCPTCDYGDFLKSRHNHHQLPPLLGRHSAGLLLHSVYEVKNKFEEERIHSEKKQFQVKWKYVPFTTINPTSISFFFLKFPLNSFQ